MRADGMGRRRFLQAGLAVAGSFTLGRDFWTRAYAAPAKAGPSPYGSLLPADANGLLLPDGFTSRRVATSYEPVARADGSVTEFTWHRAPDGGGVFPQPDGGWIYVSNSEVPIIADELVDQGPTDPEGGSQGGCSAIRFDADGNVVDAYSILSGTNNNCAGGVTPWGTWLSCEENFGGWVYECDPTGDNLPVRMLAMGQFNHEAAAVDPETSIVYMTEDAGDGAFYRFRPTTPGDLRVGVLEVLVMVQDPRTRVPHQQDVEDVLRELPGVDPDDFPWRDVIGEVQEPPPGKVTWVPVPNPQGLPVNTRYQVPTAAVFDGGEGCWYDSGFVYWTCKGSNRVWSLDVANDEIDIVYDAADQGGSPVLTGVDNLVVHAQSHDLYVAEDGGNMELVIVTADTREVAPFLRYPIEGSELAGPAFDESGTRLYLSSQAKREVGETFEITGPFRGTAAAGSITVRPPAQRPATEGVGGPRPAPALPATGAGFGATAVGLAGVAAVARRRSGPDGERGAVARGSVVDHDPVAEVDRPGLDDAEVDAPKA